MKIAAKTDYACRALLELSLHWPNTEPLRIQDISERQNIPLKFLTQILIQLKQLGYVQSIRGKSGGYLLSMEPVNIKLSQVLQNFDESGFSNGEQYQDKRVMSSIWREVDKSIIRKLDEITFETIANRHKEMQNVVMFHI